MTLAAIFALAADQPPIPAPDRFGIPGHWAVFLALYHVTFVLHLLFMNYVLGGSVICLANDLRCLRPRNRNRLSELNWRIGRGLPIALSFAITFGVAPLLFVQVLYGQFFYTANVLVGLPWMAVIGVLIVTFYLAYYLTLRRHAWGLGKVLLRIVLSAAVLAGLVYIAAMLTLNAVWSINPEAWQARYDSAPLLPTIPDGQFLWRLGHNLVGATAVACLLLAVMSRVWLRRGAVDADFAARTVRSGLIAAAVLTAVQAGLGGALVLALRAPVEHHMLVSPDDLNVWAWRVGIGAAAVGLLCMIVGIGQPRRPFWPWMSLGCVAVTLAGMSAGRQAVRVQYLAPHFSLSDWTGRTVHQPFAMAVFLLAFVVMVVAVGWLLWAAWTAKPQPVPAPAPEPAAAEQVELSDQVMSGYGPVSLTDAADLDDDPDLRIDPPQEPGV